MLLWKEVTHATDLDLLTVLIGDRKKATKLFAKAKFSLFACSIRSHRRTAISSAPNAQTRMATSRS
jgi:hypothetical protein